MAVHAPSFVNLTWLDESHTPRTGKSFQCSGDRTIHSRRSHTKSRNGCKNCKRRRIKCDESKLGCSQCERHHIPCDFTSIESLPEINRTSPQELPWISAAAFTMSLAVTASECARMLYPEAMDRSIRPKTALVDTLQHFQTIAYDTIGCPRANELMQAYALSLSQNAPFLLHAIFAFSLNHLAYLNSNARKHEREARHHNQRAMELFSQETAHEVAPDKIDAVIACSMIMCALGFEAGEVSVSAPAQDRSPCPPVHQQAKYWVSALYTDNVAPHLSYITPYFPRSVWYPLMVDLATESLTSDSNSSFSPSSSVASSSTSSPPQIGFDLEFGLDLDTSLDLGLDLDLELYLDERMYNPSIGSSSSSSFSNLPYSFISLCNLDSSEPFASLANPYSHALSVLSAVLRLEPTVSNFNKLFAFPCRLRQDFMARLQLGDPVAFLVMSYWLARICLVDRWWCASRAITECRTLCRFLDGHPDPRVKELLEFPIQACGYVAIDPDLIQTCVFGM